MRTIKSLRIDNNLTQLEMSKILGMPYSVYNGLERAGDAATLRDLAKALKVKSITLVIEE